MQNGRKLRGKLRFRLPFSFILMLLTLERFSLDCRKGLVLVLVLVLLRPLVG